jgi:uncharacterized protein YkwD
MKSNLVLLLVFVMSTSFAPPYNSSAVIKVYSEEVKLYNLIMDYRKAYNLPVIPLSRSLTFVAQEHCRDAAPVTNVAPEGKCRVNSVAASAKWSDNTMWGKPKELTNYPSNGYELAYSSCCAVKAEKVINRWTSSSYHNEIILNQGYWKKCKWNAIGIGIQNGYATVWFGEVADNEGSPIMQ